MDAKKLHPNALLPSEWDREQCTLKLTCNFVITFLQGKPAH